MTDYKFFIHILLLLSSLWMTSCGGKQEISRILYVNSYHPGYPSSDEIAAGIKATVENRGIDLKIVYMDTKRNQEEASIQKKAREIIELIEDYNPGVLIVSDDNAVQHLVVPYLLGSRIPIIFCGVNWTAEPYGLPEDHITGMLEILPVEKGIGILKEQGLQMTRVAILSENSASEQKNITFISAILEKAGISSEYLLASTFEEWKAYFMEASQTADAIYMPTNGAVRDWDHEEAIRFIRESIRVPLITCDDFMMPYVVVGVTKVQSEQGIWAGETALKISNGAEVSTISRTSNSQIRIWWNPVLAEKINFKPGELFLKEAIRFE
ncbi:MAG: hypothetical protein KFF73_19405 [Cyclobacteriaceae bacterium]|nr:hypothetical protein [Cyclobacteriaceae bacterium]